jgi:hypothetical protein
VRLITLHNGAAAVTSSLCMSSLMVAPGFAIEI